MPKKGKKSSGNRSRPPLARMLRIHEQISSGKKPNCFNLGQEFEVSYKTIQRDIDFMRDQLSLPVEYDSVARGFYYSQAVASFPTVTVSEGELVALLVAQKALEQYRGTPFEKPIASAFSKLAGSLDKQQGISLHQLSEAFSFKPASLAARDLKAFQTVAESVVAHQVLTFRYAGLSGGEAAPRRVEPYHLGCIADQWYVIGKDLDRRAMRTFALPRMHEVRKGKETFSRPADFDIGRFLSGSFSAFQATKVETVRLKLDKFAARMAEERRWHHSQTLRRSRSGGAELTLKVGVAPDLENWILSWGGHAEVLAPASLRRRIGGLLKAAARHY